MSCWQLDIRFESQIAILSSQMLVYHSGSGQTHLLSPESAQIVHFFLQNPEKKYKQAEVEQRFSSIPDLNDVLNELHKRFVLVKGL